MMQGRNVSPVFCSRTPNRIPQWFTQYGCCISTTSPISGGASSQNRLDMWHCMKFCTSGMTVFGPSPRRPHPNHGWKFVYDTIEIWHNISQHYLGIVGSRGFGISNQKGIDALTDQNIAGIVWLQIFCRMKQGVKGQACTPMAGPF